MVAKVILDWKRTLYDPEINQLIPYTNEVLTLLKERGIQMILIGKGGEEMYKEVNHLGVKKYFAEIIFQEGKKDRSIFAKYISQIPEETLFIGDRVRSELEIGNLLGATTIWVKQGKFAIEEPLNNDQKPTHIVNNLQELRVLLTDLL